VLSFASKGGRGFGSAFRHQISQKAILRGGFFVLCIALSEPVRPAAVRCPSCPVSPDARSPRIVASIHRGGRSDWPPITRLFVRPSGGGRAHFGLTLITPQGTPNDRTTSPD